MNDIQSGPGSSEMPPNQNGSGSTSTEIRSLYEDLTGHLQACSQCQKATQSTPVGRGMVTKLCSEYQRIIQRWADREGAVNNIVAHDEYGNQASQNYHENYPNQWG